MARRIMTRHAADNVYLHRDFHGALSCALDYLAERHGPASVPAFLDRFVRAYYGPVRAAIRSEGLPAVVRHWRQVYAIEGAAIDVVEKPGEVVITTTHSPAVAHIRSRGYPLAASFVETIRTVNESLCDGSGIRSELVAYDPETGASTVRFSSPSSPAAGHPEGSTDPIPGGESPVRSLQ